MQEFNRCPLPPPTAPPTCPFFADGPESHWTDTQILTYIDGMGDMQVFDRLLILDLRHYNVTQRAWIALAAYFTGIHLGRPPTQTEIAEDFVHRNTPRRFKAYYYFRFPNKVSWAVAASA